MLLISQFIIIKTFQRGDEEEHYELNVNQSVPSPTKVRYCADFSPIKDLFENRIDPLCAPLVDLLPEDMQAMLLDRIAFLDLSKASCVFVAAILLSVYSVWFWILRMGEKSQKSMITVLNEQMVSLNIRLKEAKWTSDTFSGVIVETQKKLDETEASLKDKEVELDELNEKYQNLVSQHGELARNVQQNGASESSLHEELNRVKQRLAEISEKHSTERSELESRLAQVEAELREKDSELEYSNDKYQNILSELNGFQIHLRERDEMRVEIEKLNETIALLRASLVKQASETAALSRKNSTHLTNGNHDPNSSDQSDEANESILSIDNLMKIAQLEMRIKELESMHASAQLEHETKLREFANSSSTLAEKERSIETLKAKLKDAELQVKMARELREQDTKQHVKTMNDMDTQLKKKSNEAEKVSHLLEQIKLKQERLHELEGQFARIERQSNQERQTYEKQAHENWLNGRKIDKELKETKAELASMKGLYTFDTLA
jgi:DNA repair exonuclease SbcCD ATPase subunit